MTQTDPSIATEPPEQRRTLVILVLAQVLSGVALAAGVTVGALLAQDMLGSARLSGLPSALFAAGGAVAAVGVGRLSERSGRRRTHRGLSGWRRWWLRRGGGLAGQCRPALHLVARLRCRRSHQSAGSVRRRRPGGAGEAWPRGEHCAGGDHPRRCGGTESGDRYRAHGRSRRDPGARRPLLAGRRRVQRSRGPAVGNVAAGSAAAGPSARDRAVWDEIRRALTSRPHSHRSGPHLRATSHRLVARRSAAQESWFSPSSSWSRS